MASTPFTLAAFATSAVPQLEVTATRAHTSQSNGMFDSAVLATTQGELIIRVPLTPAAEVQQSGELLGRAALTDGARESLPFEVPRTLGLTRVGDTRAVVSTFLAGVPASLADFEQSAELLRSAASAIAAIHRLPSSVVRDGGLPLRDSGEVRMVASRLVDRAAGTGMLPSTVELRWTRALEVDSLWSFDPVVTHGGVEAEALIVEGDQVTGVLGWEGLSLGDPATDLTWLFEGSPDVAEAALAQYASQRDLSGIRELNARAKFYRELEIARWLLHGVDSHDQSIIDDAVAMLDRLVDSLNLLGAPEPGRPVLSESEVEQLLEHTPEIGADLRSETVEFEALDEDRVFEPDGDFGEDAPADAPAEPRDSSVEQTDATEKLDSADAQKPDAGSPRE